MYLRRAYLTLLNEQQAEENLRNTSLTFELQSRAVECDSGDRRHLSLCQTTNTSVRKQIGK